ncbi:MAG: hypothetical protein IMZ57_02005, partial [Acidobacteria bacterium]|nr:hypothetical protein [Acidobacteriota bacterium]
MRDGRRRLIQVFLVLVFCLPVAGAQDSNQANAAELVKIIHKIDGLVLALMSRISECEMNIRDCDKTISQSEKIISLAGQQGHSEAKATAGVALRKAQEARKNYLEQKTAGQEDLIRLRKARENAVEKWRSYEFPDESVDPVANRYIKGMAAAAERLGWSAEERKRLDDNLNALGVDVPLNASAEKIKSFWSSLSARREDPDLAAAASQGEGPGFLGGDKEQNGNDCAVHALATATGLPYEDVAARAKDLIRQGDWRSASERKDPQGVIKAGLAGGEVVMLAESIGQAWVIPPSGFAGTLKRGDPVLVNISPQKGDAGHQVVLTKTFQHDGETWYQMADSNWPGKRMFIKEAELNLMLKENGVAFVSKDKKDS